MKVIYNDGRVAELNDAEEELHVLRHSAAHIMAQAIKRRGFRVRAGQRERILL